jgi:hypothetical protein
MPDSRPRAIPRNISMYPDQWALVEAVAQDAGKLSLSAAVRLILSEWQQLKATDRRTPAGPSPRP